jgi:hypothetical protein
VSIFINKSFLRRAPIGSLRILNSWEIILSIFIDFYACGVSARARDVIFDVGVYRFWKSSET